MMRQNVAEAKPLLAQTEIPSYFNFSENQLNRLKYALLQLKKHSEAKQIMVFSIPTAEETIQFKKNEINPLGEELNVFCKAQEIPYLDLIVPTSKLSEAEIYSLFLACDGHWSKQGNSYAMQQIQTHFNYYQK